MQKELLLSLNQPAISVLVLLGPDPYCARSTLET
jgi:hypothetical protein